MWRGFLQGVEGVDPVCMWRERLQGQTGINRGFSKMKQLGQDSAGEVRKDGIRGQDHNERKQSRERAPLRLAI